ncbi:hypothetical protein [Fimbriimonas ginsengisoli]|uniref:Lipoprotein n=1 Tax=Fimbriimonas ginsengisoli Gsoil 348 TaxID=661478 RepID=A0A068NSU9_FIMGI|nr:hypothetical protein [Fimbriimonas ginsengisoli]AIE86432.1 hypothetical protein OP10G_3064 [Fimbriimonas ginsengisoli Gsoil 348]
MRTLRWTPILALAILGGCQAKDAANPTSGGSATSSGTASTTTTPPKLDVSQIPADLKHDGYAYYGLGSAAPMKMEIRSSSQPNQVLTGTQTIALKEIKDGKPVFTISRDGQLGDLVGQQEVVLEKDGIYNTASTVAKVGAHDLELPAKLAPGVKWTSHTEVDRPDKPEQQLEDNSTCTVVGPQKVTTKVGEHDALLITSSGKGTIAGKKVVTTSKSWYVKDRGSVKTVLSTTFPDGKVQTITIQEVK